MKSVLISIQPKWCELIAAGKKTVEVRKSKPKLETPFKCYIYCTKDFKPNNKYGFKLWAGRGKVIGEFVCDRVYQYASDMFRSAPVEGTDISTEDMAKLSCLTAKELYEYEHSTEPRENRIYLVGVYGWHVSDLLIYEKPKELNEFKQCHKCKLQEGCVQHEYSCDGSCKLQRPPQSWCYVEELNDGK